MDPELASAYMTALDMDGTPDSEIVPMSSLGRELHPLTPEEIKEAVASEIQDALAYIEEDINPDRETAMNYYHGEEFGNEVEGQSKVILTDVRDTIEWILPQLMRIFTASGQVVRYEPTVMEELEASEQATELVNHRFMQEMDGYQLLYDFFKTALLEKVGFTKTYVERKMVVSFEEYHDLTELELAKLIREEGVEIIAHEEDSMVFGVDPETEEPVSMPVFSVRVKRTAIRSRVTVDGIPPEEFLIARRATTLDDDTPFCAHRKQMSRSELIALGFDIETVLALPLDDSPEWSSGRNARNQNRTTNVGFTSRPDPASDPLWVHECYIRIDEDGDGYAEMRQITCVGQDAVEILEDKPVNRNGFAALCPVPMPHAFFGESMADLVLDLQLIRSTLLRQMLDNMYLTNAPRVGIVEGEVEVDDILEPKPGGMIRMTAPGMIEPIPTQPFGAWSFQMLEHLEEIRQNRTGITKYTQGMDASSLNQTATGIGRIMDAAQMRIELIAALFAGGGLKHLFRNILRSMVEGGGKEEAVRLRGEWIPVNPSTWNADMDVIVKVGLGVGQAQEMLSNLQLIGASQEKLQEQGLGAGYMVTPRNVYQVVRETTKAMGFGAEELFFTDPGDNPPPDPKPTPEEVKNEQDYEMKKTELALKGRELDIDAAQNEALETHRAADLAMKERVEMEKIKSNETIALAQIKAKPAPQAP
jgi:hypothetical protein